MQSHMAVGTVRGRIAQAKQQGLGRTRRTTGMLTGSTKGSTPLPQIGTDTNFPCVYPFLQASDRYHI